MSITAYIVIGVYTIWIPSVIFIRHFSDSKNLNKNRFEIAWTLLACILGPPAFVTASIAQIYVSATDSIKAYRCRGRRAGEKFGF